MPSSASGSETRKYSGPNGKPTRPAKAARLRSILPLARQECLDETPSFPPVHQPPVEIEGFGRFRGGRARRDGERGGSRRSRRPESSALTSASRGRASRNGSKIAPRPMRPRAARFDTARRRRRSGLRPHPDGPRMGRSGARLGSSLRASRFPVIGPDSNGMVRA